MKVFKVNSFTYNRTGGNPAGIILLDAPLSDARKQEIAKTLGYSETAFVLKSNGALADFELSFFTPTDEVPLCGHATIAAFSVLYQERLLPKFHLVQQTKAGCLRIEVEEGSAMVFMEQTTPKGQAISESSVRDLGRIFHLPVESLACEYDALSHSFPLNAEIWDTGIRDIILPIKNRALLNALKIDFDALSKLSKSEDVCGVHAFTYEDGQFYARNFAPLFGIDEESATGTSNGALTGYLYHHIRQNGFAKMKTLELKILQGEAMNATSEIHTRCLDENGLTPEIWVGGMATVEETFEI